MWLGPEWRCDPNLPLHLVIRSKRQPVMILLNMKSYKDQTREWNKMSIEYFPLKEFLLGVECQQNHIFSGLIFLIAFWFDFTACCTKLSSAWWHIMWQRLDMLFICNCNTLLPLGFSLANFVPEAGCGKGRVFSMRFWKGKRKNPKKLRYLYI